MNERICTSCNRGTMWRATRKGWREWLFCRIRRLYAWECGYCNARVLLRDRGEKKRRRRVTTGALKQV